LVSNFISYLVIRYLIPDYLVIPFWTINYQPVQELFYIILAVLDKILISHSYHVLLSPFRDGHHVIQKVV
jgi:hypothetical protein